MKTQTLAIKAATPKSQLLCGLQKTTLIDFPGEIACTVFFYGCNFRCPFCHNPELVTERPDPELYTFDEVLEFLKERVGKLDGVVFCGGEPLIQHGIIEAITSVKKLGFKVKIDTNGGRPDVIRELLKLGVVDYWAMDIKNSEELYGETAGVKIDLAKINESIRLIRGEDPIVPCETSYEFRTTFVPGLHSEDSVDAMGKLINGSKKFFIQNFRKGKVIDQNRFSETRSFTEAELLGFKAIMEKYVEIVTIR